MPWTMHVIAATSFFIFALTAQALTTIKCRSIYYALPEEIQSQFMHIYSLYSKIGVVGASIVILLVNLMAGVFHWKGPYSNICEWTGTLLILIYNASFCHDWYGSVNTNVTLAQQQEPREQQQLLQQQQDQQQPIHHQQQQQQFNQQHYAQYLQYLQHAHQSV